VVAGAERAEVLARRAATELRLALEDALEAAN